MSSLFTPKEVCVFKIKLKAHDFDWRSIVGARLRWEFGCVGTFGFPHVHSYDVYEARARFSVAVFRWAMDIMDSMDSER